MAMEDLIRFIRLSDVERVKQALSAVPKEALSQAATSKKDGWTALHVAASIGNESVIRLLLEAGADRHRATRDGELPLMLSIRGGHVAACRLFLGGSLAATPMKPSRFSSPAAAKKVPLVKPSIYLMAAVDLHNSSVAAELVGLLVEHVKGSIPSFTPQKTSGQNGGVVDSPRPASDVLKLTVNFVMGADGVTPLHRSAERNHVRVAALLLQCGADPNVRTAQGELPIHWAAQRGHSDMVSLLLNHAGHDRSAAAASTGNTALHYATANGHLNVVEMLVGSNYDVDRKNHRGLSALDIARKNRRQHKEVYEYLLPEEYRASDLYVVRQVQNDARFPLQMRASPSSPGAMGLPSSVRSSTPMQGGVRTPSVATVEPSTPGLHRDALRRSAGISVATTRSSQFGPGSPGSPSADLMEREVTRLKSRRREDPKPSVTQLLEAIESGDANDVRVIIEGGLSPNVHVPNVKHEKQPLNYTLLHFAVKAGHKDVTHVLLEMGADPNRSGRYRTYPIHLAASDGRSDLVDELVEYGADVNVGTDVGRTPLHLAVLHGHDGLVQTLLRNHASVDLLTAFGDTPLHWASSNGRTVITKLLLAHRANLNVRNSDGLTALQIAERKGSEEIASLIRHKLLFPEEDASSNSTGATPKGWMLQPFIQDQLKRQRDQQKDVTSGFSGKYMSVKHIDPEDLIFDALYRHDMKRLDQLLGSGIDPNTPNKSANGDTPLHVACRSGHRDAVKLLLSRGADAMALNDIEQLPIDAAQPNVKDLLQVYMMRKTTSTGERTPVAAAQARQAAMRTIVRDSGSPAASPRGAPGALPPSESQRDARALMHRIEGGRNSSAVHSNVSESDIASVSMLSSHHRSQQPASTTARSVVVASTVFEERSGTARSQQSSNARNPAVQNAIDDAVKSVSALSLSGGVGGSDSGSVRSGMTRLSSMAASVLDQQALFDAAATGDTNRVRLLLSMGVNVSGTTTSGGRTALHAAAGENQVTVMEMLLLHGVSPNVVADDGETPLHIACSRGAKEAADLLIRQGANIDARAIISDTPLHWACISGHLGIAEMLVLKYKANINVVTQFGDTPLINAAMNGHEKIVELLLHHGAEVNRASNDGMSALHWAAQQGREEIVELLLRSHADVGLCNRDGRTAAELAELSGHNAVATQLMKKRMVKTFFKNLITST